MKTALVVTTISAPNDVLRALAAGCQSLGYPFYVIGDTKTPGDFRLKGTEYFDLLRQQSSEFQFASMCPSAHYARKNIGYLLAIQAGADVIIETDDDNFPQNGFWEPRERKVQASLIKGDGSRNWVNVYKYFSDTLIWPRGLPLSHVYASLPVSPVFTALDCPIQQGLVDDDPDVDAIYRMTSSGATKFWRDKRVALMECWCPFNSQNTAWWSDAFPLLYLPSTCSVRATDIWRSFVAQRIAWANNWPILFKAPDVFQTRNKHNLNKDLQDEMSMHFRNESIVHALSTQTLVEGVDQIPDNMRVCYEALARQSLISKRELPLLDAWIKDLEKK